MSRKVFTLKIGGIPAGQPRARATVRPGSRHATVYNQTRARGSDGIVRDLPITTWRKAIEACASALIDQHEARTFPLSGPTAIHVQAYFPRPQYLEHAGESDGPIPHEIPPDRDNLDKPILDVLQAMGILTNDAQVYTGQVEKWYVERGYRPGAVVRIEPMPGPAKVRKGQTKPKRLREVLAPAAALTWIRVNETIMGSDAQTECLEELRVWLEQAIAASMEYREIPPPSGRSGDGASGT